MGKSDQVSHRHLPTSKRDSLGHCYPGGDFKLAVFYLTGLISKSFPKRQAIWMQALRERVAFTSNWLDTSKAVKMLGISEPVSVIAQQLRVKELNLQKKFRYSFVTMNLVAGIPSNLGPAITLSIYTGIAFWTGRDPLTEAQTFMALSIIILASNPLSNLVYSAPRVAGVIESFQRIQEYLLETPRHDYRTSMTSKDPSHRAPERRIFRWTKEQFTAMGKDPGMAVKLPDEIFGLGPDAYMGGLDVFYILHCYHAIAQKPSRTITSTAKNTIWKGTDRSQLPKRPFRGVLDPFAALQRYPCAVPHLQCGYNYDHLFVG